MARALHDELLELFERHRLTPAQRRLAHEVIQHPGEVMFLGAAELASRVGVSQPSVTRFAQALGFEGYPEFLSFLRRLVSARPAEEQAVPNRYQDAVTDEITNLEALRADLGDTTVVSVLGAELATSMPLPVLGFRASADIARYFTFFAAKVHPDVRLVDHGGSRATDALLQAHDGGATWLLAFALPRVPTETVQAVSFARDLGYQVAVCTAERLGPAAALADTVLPVRVGTRLLFDSQAAPLVLSAVLVDALAAAAPGRTQRRLDAFEKLAADRDYWVDG